MSEEEKSRELSIRRDKPFSLFQEMDRMFDEVARSFDDWFLGPSRFPRIGDLMKKEEGPIFRTPLTNIKESDGEFEIAAEMPGLDKGDIEVSFHDGLLEIKGEIEEEEKEEEKGEVVRSEYRSSSYYRAFTLPENIDEDAIDANLEKGVLTVKIPKKEPEPVEKKKIEVK
ncbi:MAG: Hsp20/alpha crystallin family protein [Promethearchaeota archaeon]|nr:MAG: Hsp20/alpha crystallin family protein [Candidatus Lokiarchaeota archaeon]